MSENESGGNDSPYAGLVEKIASNLDADWAQVQQQRANDESAFRAFTNHLDAVQAKADASERGLATRDENWGKAKRFWGGVKMAERVQRIEDATWRGTQKEERSMARNSQAFSVSRSQ